MTKQEADKEAHVFYGMTADMYDEGYRFDFDKAEQVATDNGTLKLRIPLLKDGEPFVIAHTRPNTMGTLIGITE